MNFIKTFETYRSESEFISDVVDVLKTYNISPVLINKIIDFYQDQIINYFYDGKTPNQFVEENLSELELDKEKNWTSMKFSKNWSGELKYL
jgi:hypothetical protein